VSRECPICGFAGEGFAPGGRNQRPNALCPSCRSLERQRLVWLYMLTETELLRPQTAVRMLHISPDASLESKLAGMPWIGQLTADLNPAGVMVEMDVTDIRYPSDFFDVVYCSHVLEHVPDDLGAMRELLRVLTPTGWGILQVPITRELTEEDPSVTSAAERTARFGQDDHVRSYGRDYPERLAQAGFAVTVDPYPRRIGSAVADHFGITAHEELYVVRKPPPDHAGSVHHPLRDLLGGGEEGSGISGRIESVRNGAVHGWAWDAGEPQRRIEVRATVDGVEIGSDLANRERSSLAAAGIGDGLHAFRISLPRSACTPGPHHLRVVAAGSAPLPPATAFTVPRERSADPWYVLDVAR
jgi:SAM-dependent methyltransferase